MLLQNKFGISKILRLKLRHYLLVIYVHYIYFAVCLHTFYNSSLYTYIYKVLHDRMDSIIIAPDIPMYLPIYHIYIILINSIFIMNCIRTSCKTHKDNISKNNSKLRTTTLNLLSASHLFIYSQLTFYRTII